MDAYDIFKKLTKGARFIKTHNPILYKDKARNEQNNNELDIKIKEEVIDDYPEVESFKDIDENNENKNSITLLSSLSNFQPKTGKKRKLETQNDVDRKKRLLENERINHYRNINHINAVGKNIPAPAKIFEDFQVDQDLVQNLRKCGYEEPTPIQKQAVPIMLQGRQLLACAPTGSGKTAAFLVPIINLLQGPQKQGFRALILCPTRELAKQTQRECVLLSEGRGFKIHVISKIKQALSQYNTKSSQKFDILITTPNRLCFLLNQDPPAILLANVEWVVIDEADKLFEAGNRGFREQLDQILKACTNSRRKITMFSATHTPVVAKWCVHNMKNLIRITVGQRNAATDLVDQELLFVGNEQGKLIAFRDLIRKGLAPPVLIFVQSKERAQQLFNELIYDGINVDAIHAERTQLQRDNTVRSFREGKIWVLICTELMARGVDFKGVNLVINYDFPPSAISYVHRVGRAGRAGRKGKAITFFTTEDTVNLRSIAHVLKDSGCEVPPYMLQLKKRNKKEKKQLEKAAPQRDDISTKPIYEEILKQKRRRRANEKSQTGNLTEVKKNGLKLKKRQTTNKPNHKLKGRKINKETTLKPKRKKNKPTKATVK